MPADGEQMVPADGKQTASTRGNQTKPRIDDQFWLNLSAEMVSKAASSQNAAAARVQKMTAWLWGIYTASVAVGGALSEVTYDSWFVGLTVIPSFCMIFAYVFAGLVQTPFGVEFDPRAPADIREAFYKGVRAKRLKLRVATVLLVAGAVSIWVAIAVASLFRPWD